MTGSTRNWLKIYGQPDRREFVCGIVSGLFGRCVEDISGLEPARDVDGTLLAAVRFDWPAGPPVGWVAELSARMPTETFECLTDFPYSGGSDREVIRAGVVSDGCYPPNTFQIPDELPVSVPAILKLRLPLEHPLDLVAVARAKLDYGYVYVYESIETGVGIDWRDRHEMNELAADIEVITSLLSPSEAASVARLKEQHRNLAEQMAARLNAVESLQEASRRLTNPHVAGLLDDSDRQVIARLADIVAKVRLERDFEPDESPSDAAMTGAVEP